MWSWTPRPTTTTSTSRSTSAAEGAVRSGGRKDLREHPGVPVRVEERGEPDHSGNLAGVAVEPRAHAFEMCARGVDVLHPPGRDCALGLQLLRLAKADVN